MFCDGEIKEGTVNETSPHACDQSFPDDRRGCGEAGQQILFGTG